MKKFYSGFVVVGVVLVIAITWTNNSELIGSRLAVFSKESSERKTPLYSHKQSLSMQCSLNSHVDDKENRIDNSSKTKHGTDFVYDNDALYEAVIGTNKKNCMRAYNNLTLCQSMTDCKIIDSSDCAKRLPKAIIIGVFKAGTRELIDFLAMHPRIRIQRYEIHFFNNKYNKGLEWYRSAMPLSLGNQITIEKSPGYFSSKLASQKIYETDPDIKLLLLVREPASRVISHFTFDLSKPPRERPRFKSLDQCAMKNETFNVETINPNCQYVYDSLYSEHLRNYLQYFKRDQIHIIDSVDFAKNPCTVLKEVEKYLELEPMIDCNDLVCNEERGFYCVVDPFGKHKGVCFSERRGRTGEEKKSLEPNIEHLKTLLKKFYAPYNEEFYKITRKQFEW